MKNLSLALVLGGLTLIALGCPAANSPSSPGATSTPTLTRTITLSPTVTLSTTATASSTETLAPTNTTTVVPSPTSTETSSPIPTSTETATPSSTATTTATHTACVATVLFNGCESLSANGTWTGGGAIRSFNTTNATEGTNAMQIAISSATGWHNGIANLESFQPFLWDAYTQLIADVTVDASVIAGAGYAQLVLRADSCVEGDYGQSAYASNDPGLVAGTQTLTWNLSAAAGSVLPGSALSKIYFVYNNGSPNASPGTGNITIDNIRLAYPCSSVPPTYPLWAFGSNIQAWGYTFGPGGATASWASPGYSGPGGCFNYNVPFTAQNQTAELQYTANCFTGNHLPADLTGRSIRAWIWIDNGMTDGTPGSTIYFQSNNWGAWEESGWTNLTPGAWTLVTFTPTWVGGNAADIQRIGIKVMTGGSGTVFGTGNIKVDDIEIY